MEHQCDPIGWFYNSNNPHYRLLNPINYIKSMMQVIQPFSLIDSAIAVVKNAAAIDLIIPPLADVCITSAVHEAALAFGSCQVRPPTGVKLHPQPKLET